MDLSFESDGESVIDLTDDSPIRRERRHSPTHWVANEPHASSSAPSPLAQRLDQLAHEYRDYTSPSANAVTHGPDAVTYAPDAVTHAPDATWPAPEEDGPDLDPPLSEQQRDVLRRCMKGESIFFTGSAGTGKSVLLRALIKRLKARLGRDGDVAVTASTGMAAL